MSTVYSPDPFALEFQVIQYFTTNPEEELTTADIGEKFGVHPAQVHTKLARALGASALSRRSNGDDELVYSLGTGTTNVKADKAKHPSLRRGSAPRVDQALAGKPKKTRDRSPLPSFDAIPLEKNVPLPPVGGGHVKTDWPALFNRMKPGESCVLPRRVKASLGKAITEFGKAKAGELSTRMISDTELRLWRIK
jgi:hypothetical protein